MDKKIAIVDKLITEHHKNQFKELQKLKIMEENPDPRGDAPDIEPKSQETGPTAFRFKFALDKDNDILVGYTMMVFANPESEMQSLPPGMGFTNGYILKEYRRQKIGSLLLEETIKQAKTEHLNYLLFNSSLEGGLLFLQSKGAVVQSKHIEQRLYLGDIDQDLINNWNSLSLPDGYHMEFVETIPEKDLQQFCDFYTDLSNNQTRDHNDEKHPKRVTPEDRRYSEKIAGEVNHKWYTLLIRNSNDDIIGMTEIYYQPQEDFAIRQNLTGVLPEERGHGFGKILKSKMIERISSEFPNLEYIYTSNDTTNQPMRGINTKLGFKAYNTVYSLGLDLE